ncbi:hypothetical protein QBC47DRAFT_151651 [Echria macrotheca]|uniref:F-box domain-containing protein n=1 Tax=Echria macrotheca TaxID=438768 RepID=A0AAJ0B2A7_9PEZI|nr:hypothetical protein QBC47DRAFT_151651 [Echria macrotheca]
MASLTRRIPFFRDPGADPARPRPARPGPAKTPTTSDTDSPEPGASSASPTPTSPSHKKPTFTTLPPEIHLLITRHLIYPDALSLKHTSRYFYSLVDTGVRLKIDWLVERRRLHLECPNDRRCDLGSDLRFCRGSVRLLMQRRREHIECESRPGLGCLINGTETCPHARRLKTRMKRWLRVRLSIELWGLLLLLAVVPVLVGVLCVISF